MTVALQASESSASWILSTRIQVWKPNVFVWNTFLPKLFFFQKHSSVGLVVQIGHMMDNYTFNQNEEQKRTIH